MKIYVNRRPVTGPWGGGNKTVTALANKLEELGHEVVFKLCEGIDIIFCFDPRPNAAFEWYQHFLDYKIQFGAKIIQRVGDCGTHGKPELTLLVGKSALLSDFLIFPSQWARDFVAFAKTPNAIIENAPLVEFYNNRNQKINPLEKVRIVTHHWSTNPKKGFEYYKFLDDYLTNNDTNIEFTYIGRIPEDLKFKTVNYHEPTGDNDLLSKLISQSDIYLTASEEEAGANHVLEALACGIPIIYHEKGGSIVDYCKDYGIEYKCPESLLDAINKMSQNYEHFKKNALKFDRTIDNVIDEYIEVINNVQSQH